MKKFLCVSMLFAASAWARVELTQVPSPDGRAWDDIHLAKGTQASWIWGTTHLTVPNDDQVIGWDFYVLRAQDLTQAFHVSVVEQDDEQEIFPDAWDEDAPINFSDSGNFMAFNAVNSVRIYDLRSGQMLHSFPRAQRPVDEGSYSSPQGFFFSPTDGRGILVRGVSSCGPNDPSTDNNWRFQSLLINMENFSEISVLDCRNSYDDYRTSLTGRLEWSADGGYVILPPSYQEAQQGAFPTYINPSLFKSENGALVRTLPLPRASLKIVDPYIIAKDLSEHADEVPYQFFALNSGERVRTFMADELYLDRPVNPSKFRITHERQGDDFRLSEIFNFSTLDSIANIPQDVNVSNDLNFYVSNDEATGRSQVFRTGSAQPIVSYLRRGEENVFFDPQNRWVYFGGDGADHRHQFVTLFNLEHPEQQRAFRDPYYTEYFFVGPNSEKLIKQGEGSFTIQNAADEVLLTAAPIPGKSILDPQNRFILVKKESRDTNTDDRENLIGVRLLSQPDLEVGEFRIQGHITEARDLRPRTLPLFEEEDSSDWSEVFAVGSDTFVEAPHTVNTVPSLVRIREVE